MIQPPPGMALVPEARGKAAAFDRWLALGGGNPQRMGRGGKFPSGPMKGLTYDQAKQKFESMWAGASGAIKDKYARRSAGDLAPSERPAVMPPLPADAMKASQKTNRMGFYKRIGMAPATVATPAYDKDRNGVPDMIQRPAEATSGSDLSKQAMGTPEQQAQVAAMMGENSDLATAFNAPTAANGGVGTAVDVMSAMAAGNREEARRQAVSEGVVTPQQAQAAASQDAAAKDARKARDEAAMLESKRRQDQILRDQAGIAPPAPASAAPIPSVAAPVAPPQSSPVRKPAIPSSTPAMQPTPTGATVLPKPGKGLDSAVADTNGAMRRVNSLTGLPMGYNPGDALPSGADNAMKGRAMDSIARQSFATPTATPRDIAGAQRTMESAGVTPVGSMTRNAPRAVPVATPAPPTFAQRMRVTPGPKIANPDDPRKFFTGRVLPLDQLVKR